MGSRFDSFNTMRSFMNSFSRINHITDQFSNLANLSISKINLPTVADFSYMNNLTGSKLISEQLNAAALASSSLSNLLANMPKASELQNMTEALSFTANFAKNNSVLPSASEYLKIQDTLKSAYNVNELLQANTAISDFAKMQSLLPKFDEYMKIYSSLPSTMELNNYFITLKENSKSSIEYINSIKDNFSAYFNYEDIYLDTYNNIYNLIDFEKEDIVCKDDNPFELNLLDEDTKNDIPLVNQKDIIGLSTIFENISKAEARNFINHLSKYPYLGSMHEIGKRIIEELEKKVDLLTIEIQDKTLYRAKLWSDDQEIDFTIQQMWQAPYGTTPMGRFNPIGINYLYMSDSHHTAKSELKNNDKYTIIRAEVSTNFSVLDLSDFECIIFELCNKKKYDSSTNPQEYLMPNFIAQCCSFLSEKYKKNIDGLRYKSTLCEDGYCYVFFNKYPDSFNNMEIMDA